MRKLILILSVSALLCMLAIPFTTPHAETCKPTVIFEEIPAMPTVTTVPSAEEKTPMWTSDDVDALARMLWGEARGVSSVTEQAACVWCVLNRVDQGYGSILEVVTAPSQFVGYREENPVVEKLRLICEDVLTRWQRECDGETQVGRVLPADYLWFTGDGERNYFRNDYRGRDVWDWRMVSPYES